MAERPTCPLCHKWISEWQERTGKTIAVGGRVVHVSCGMDHDLTVAQLEALVRRSA